MGNSASRVIFSAFLHSGSNLVGLIEATTL